VTAGTIVVVVQPADRVEEQQPAQIHELVIELPTESRFESRLNSACESMLSKDSRQLLVDCRTADHKRGQQQK
jgi:hypothetical protein